MATVRWTAKAIGDLEAVQEFVGRTSPMYAAALVGRLVHSVDQVEAHPASGRIVPEVGRPDVRELIRGSYRIVYLLVGDRAVVLTVFRASRQFPILMLPPPVEG